MTARAGSSGIVPGGQHDVARRGGSRLVQHVHRAQVTLAVVQRFG